ncbi:MAG TPA: circularly permuted type 2 ATP-grasp protein [Burkholderiaceae bacterium]|nr:circularly permuted type 2 ATP-grasp protein [Burkholderiaceae bacterium]
MQQRAFDEMYDGSDRVRAHYREFERWLSEQTPDAMQFKRAEADLVFRRVGVTFAVYGEKDETGNGEATERLIPFDVVPRIIPAAEWKKLEAGLKQRVRALNMFLRDVYHDQDILRAGKLPADQILRNSQYRPEMRGVDVTGDIYAHIAGIDVVRASGPSGAGEYFVLEDNLRVPSGVSYMLENRKMMMRLFSDLFARNRVAPVAHYPDVLLENLRSVAPLGVDDPTVVLLTPGMYNSAYFEHAFLAQQMGIELVEGQDLFVQDNHVFMRTTRGPQRVDVIYRRIDDDFLDPRAFRKDSTLGVAGLLSVYRAGRVTLANAIGTGIADDKSIYPHVPEMIDFYLGERPILSNVPTYVCREPEQLQYTLAHLDDLVVKEVHGAGGYGMLVGPAATREERQEFAARLQANPDNYIAQPTLALSTCPTYVESGIAPRHIDLRPYVLSGTQVITVPGGLCRVALREGSLVVNSSQGGGTKDTWVLER